MTTVIADTSCLILYKKLGMLNLLKRLFPLLHVTEQVAEEYGEEIPTWVEIMNFTNQDGYLELRKFLGKGEASSIILAEELSHCLLIIDEKRGRKIAK